MYENQSDIREIYTLLAEEGKILRVLSELKSGKEATVYIVNLDGQQMAMKLYKENANLRAKNEYLQNKFYKTKSHFRATKNKNKFGKDLIFSSWIKREFTLMCKLFELGASIPKPFLHIENAIFMNLVGTTEEPAPRLKDVVLSSKQAESAFAQIVKNIKTFLEVGVIHGDLSAYNILWFQDKVWIIDFPQAIDIRQQDDKIEYLIRDLENLIEYFKQYFPINLNDLANSFENRLEQQC